MDRLKQERPMLLMTEELEVRRIALEHAVRFAIEGGDYYATKAMLEQAKAFEHFLLSGLILLPEEVDDAE
jgi:hypothetical protein